MSATIEAPVDFERFLHDRAPIGPDHLSAVSAGLDRAASGRATRLAVCGTTGSGRSRLLEHARRDAGRVGMRVLATHGRATDADLPYATMLTLLHPVVDRIDELPPHERDSLHAALYLRAADVDERAARTGMWRLLTLLAEERPLLVAIDDSDHLDGPSAGVLAFALGRLDAQAVAAVVVADGHRRARPLLAIADQTIVLDELDADSLVLAVQALAPATDAVIRRMASFAGGDRAVAAELVRGLTADQRAGRTACPLVPPLPPGTAAHAPTLATLDAAAMTALALLAADTTADATIVHTALERLHVDGDVLARLQHDGHVELDRTTIHVRRVLLQIAAYHRLDAAARRALHEALAAVMTAPHHEAARAWQLTEAVDGRATDGASAMSSVARVAMDRGDLRQAAVAHERAAELSEEHAERSTSRIAALGLWTALADAPAMRRVLAAPDDDVATRLARSAAVRWLDGDGAAVGELRAAAPVATADERPLLDALLADAAFATGHVREATETARRVASSNAGGPGRQLAIALLVLAGEAPVASMALEAHDASDSPVASRAAVRQAEAHLLMGDVDRAERALGGGDHGRPTPWDPAERHALLARLTIARGHPASAQQQLDAALTRLPAGAGLARAVLRLARAEAVFLLGDAEAAMGTMDEIVPVFQASGTTRFDAAAQRLVGRIAWSVGQADVAVACLERARRLDPAAPIGDLVALLAGLGRNQDARAWLHRIDRRPGDAAAPTDVLRARANVAAEPAGFDAAIAALHRQHLVAAEAELLIDLVAWHHRRGRWTDVMAAGERAARLLIPSGMKGWFDRLDALEPPPNAGTGDVPGVLVPLTDAERRVALSVSRGISNREVADELYLSIKTVDSHLQRIYPKLGIRSRAELAALVNGAIRSGGPLGSTTGNAPDAGR